MGILGEEPITLIRATPGTRNALGVFVPGATASSTIKASVQPLDQDEVASLPEGERRKDWLKLYTRTKIEPANQYTSEAGDRVIIDGVTYEAREAPRWRKVCPHYRVFVVRIQEGGA